MLQLGVEPERFDSLQGQPLDGALSAARGQGEGAQGQQGEDRQEGCETYLYSM